jgi:transcription elongation GreA/GreB family factor
MSQYSIKLFSDWRGYRANEVISVNKEVAIALVEQNIGDYVVSTKPEEKKFIKEIKSAPKDKQVKGAPVTK